MQTGVTACRCRLKSVHRVKDRWDEPSAFNMQSDLQCNLALQTSCKSRSYDAEVWDVVAFAWHQQNFHGMPSRVAFAHLLAPVIAMTMAYKDIKLCVVGHDLVNSRVSGQAAITCIVLGHTSMMPLLLHESAQGT